MSLGITLTVPLTRKGWIGERGMNVIYIENIYKKVYRIEG